MHKLSRHLQPVYDGVSQDAACLRVAASASSQAASVCGIS